MTYSNLETRTYSEKHATANRWLRTRLGRVCLLALSLTLGSAYLAMAPPVYAQDSEAAVQVATVNINQADAAALASGLKGVGKSRAEEIVRHREAFGPFTAVDELAEVKGIGKSTVDKNRAVISLD